MYVRTCLQVQNYTMIIKIWFIKIISSVLKKKCNMNVLNIVGYVSDV